MSNKRETGKGFEIRTGLQSGYEKWLSPQGSGQECHNECLNYFEDGTQVCEKLGWPQNDPTGTTPCYGNNLGKELDLCMADCWTPAELAGYRGASGKPYHSELGDQCFNEYVTRGKDPNWTVDANRLEWIHCLASTA